MSGTKPKSEPAAAEKKVNIEKYGQTLMDAGWTAVPSIIIERQKKLGLDATDLNIVLHLMNHWWQADNRPHPSKGRIADALGVDPRTVTAGIENGSIPSVKLGRRVVIPREKFLRIFDPDA